MDPVTEAEPFVEIVDGGLTVTHRVRWALWPSRRQAQMAVQLVAGAAAHTVTIDLDAVNRAPGHWLDLRIELPASTNPRLVVHDHRSQMTLIDFTADGVAGFFSAAAAVNQAGRWALVDFGRVGP